MWFIDNVERWSLEQSDLKALKIPFQIDEKLMAQGFLRLHLEINSTSNISGIPDDFLPMKLNVVFPSDYPFFRPMVYAQEINLSRHQNIIDKNLCLLPRQSSYWLPETTLAEYLKEQLPKVLILGMITDPKLLKDNPDEQAEPISEYFSSVPNAPIIFDTTIFDNIETVTQPIQLLGYIKLGLPSEAEVPSRMLGLECYDKNEKFIGKLPNITETIFRSTQSACIYRLAEAPPFGNSNEDYIWLNKILTQNREKIHKLKHPITLKKGNTIDNVIGITFPEEHIPGELSWGWLFFVSGTIVQQKVKGKRAFTQAYNYYAKVNRINIDELSFRIPTLKPLAEKSIAIFGLGALGAPSVIEFAKNGIRQIRIIDFDIVDAGTIVRWPLGISVAGMFKTDALERFVNDNYPYVEVQKFIYTIGAVEARKGDLTEADLSQIISLQEILKDVSMVYDATAETGISHFLSEEARKHSIPFVCIYGTQGVWGGAIMRSIPNATEGCWMCFQHGLSDGTYPLPPANDKGNIQTTGCGDISFTGTSFELGNIISAGVRLAVSTLCLDSNGYQNFETDIGILSLIDENEKPIFPKWTTHELARHSKCPYCNR